MKKININLNKQINKPDRLSCYKIYRNNRFIGITKDVPVAPNLTHIKIYNINEAHRSQMISVNDLLSSSSPSYLQELVDESLKTSTIIKRKEAERSRRFEKSRININKRTTITPGDIERAKNAYQKLINK